MSAFSPSSQSLQTEQALDEPAEAYMHWMCNDLANGSWQAEPAQPCLLYKVYSAVERITLDTHIPLRLGMNYQDILQGKARPDLQATPAQLLSWLLYYTHGLTRMLRPEAGVSSLSPLSKKKASSQDHPPRHFSGPSASSLPLLGRPVPSGGSLHPLELYMAMGAGWQFPAGVYHYDSAHHALEQLRVGDFSAAIAPSLLLQDTLQPGYLILFATIFMQKNHQKYTNLSYWLQNLDAGILIEQLRFVARCLQLPVTTHLRYLDGPLHHLLGLDTGEENIYAVLCLQAPGSSPGMPVQKIRQSPLLAQTTLPALTATHHQPFPVRPLSPLLKTLYAASLMNKDLDITTSATSTGKSDLPTVASASALPDLLPPSQEDIAQLLLRRRTGNNSLTSDTLQRDELAALLTPLREARSPLLEACHYRLYCVISRVEMLPEGVYIYREHTLLPIHQRSILPILSRISTGINIFPHLAPVNLFLSADYQEALRLYGARGLRMLGIELGQVLQRLTLAATASRLATHIHQSFHLEGTRKILLRISSPHHLPLASMMIGHPKNAQGGLFEAAWY